MVDALNAAIGAPASAPADTTAAATSGATASTQEEAAPAEESAPVPAASANALTGSAKGFAGNVAVAVDLDESGAITAITIGDDSFAETPGFGAKALEDAFKAQFIGKTLPLTAADIDAIAGATITTNAVVDALNAVVDAEEETAPAVTVAPVNRVEREVKNTAEEADTTAAATSGATAAAKEEAAPAVNRVERAVKKAVQADSAAVVLKGSAQGFAGPVAVEVTVADNTITAITIGDDSFAETPGFGAKALEDAFKAQFIGKTLPVSAADIDAIAGATITTNAVIEAINQAK